MANSSPITSELLRDNYRRLAKTVHPDLNPNDPLAGEKFKVLHEVYTEAKEKIESTYATTIGITLSESISGCERIFVIPSTDYSCLLSIPAGVQQYQNITYKNLAISKDKRIAVNAKILIDVPKGFVLVGKNKENLVYTKMVSWWTLFFGGEVTMSGPDGKEIKFDLPGRTKNGHIYKLPGHGLFDRGKKERNPLYIQFFGQIL